MEPNRPNIHDAFINHRIYLYVSRATRGPGVRDLHSQIRRLAGKKAVGGRAGHSGCQQEPGRAECLPDRALEPPDRAREFPQPVGEPLTGAPGPAPVAPGPGLEPPAVREPFGFPGIPLRPVRWMSTT